MQVNQKTITVRQLTDGYVDNNEEGVRGFGGLLDIRPPYQREFIYKDAQRDEVIRTAAKGFPLNSMYWAVRDDGTFEIIDGQQRTISLCTFVKGKFSVTGLFGMEEEKFFHNLTDEQQEKFKDYKLTVYECDGKHEEKLEWFETINIAGEELSKQELRNAVYSGKWVTDAKRYFSRINSAAYRIGALYLDGDPKRQKFLETTIKWHSKGEIEKYMAQHQHDENAEELWAYFKSVIEWTKKTFPKHYKAMDKVAWGDLHRDYKNETLDAVALEKKIAALMKDEDIRKKHGIYKYVLSGEEQHLNLRVFSTDQKTTMYERQDRKCNKCKKPFEQEDMDGDHIKPWSKGGKTEIDNCQMLCRDCHNPKGNK